MANPIWGLNFDEIGIILFSKLKHITLGFLAMSVDEQPILFTRKSIAFVIFSCDKSIQFGCLLKAKRATSNFDSNFGLLILNNTWIALTKTVLEGSYPISFTSWIASANLVCLANAVEGKLVIKKENVD
ncbi:hypothetical protein I3760_07G101600 [Carya illinoinensis]|nr:hypothetical protein I3760_07G101600 [Carya illinoinensis]